MQKEVFPILLLDLLLNVASESAKIIIDLVLSINPFKALPCCLVTGSLVNNCGAAPSGKA